MSATLRTALREACAELRAHNGNPGHRTPDAGIDAWERLTDEGEAAQIAAVLLTPTEAEEIQSCVTMGVYEGAVEGEEAEVLKRLLAAIGRVTADPSATSITVNGETYTARAGVSLTVEVAADGEPIAGGAFMVGAATPSAAVADRSEPSIDARLGGETGALLNAPPLGFDRLQSSLVAPVNLPAVQRADDSKHSEDMEPNRNWKLFSNSNDVAALQPGHARLCCARLGGVWCTEPHGHPPPCLGPEEREIASGEYGPGRRR